MHAYSHTELLIQYHNILQDPQTTRLIICDSQKEAAQVLLDLQFLFPNDPNIVLFPDWEILPYDEFSPHQDIISKRLSLLHSLTLNQPLLLIADIHTLLYRLCPPEFITQHSLKIALHQTLKLQDFKAHLNQAHYHLVTEVQEPGDFAVRGALIDIFPMGYHQAVRIEWFDDEITSIRIFDLESQLSIDKINELHVLPNKEFSFDEAAITLFRQQFRNEFSGNPSQIPLYENVSNGQLQQGLENYLPLFFTHTASIFTYLPSNTLIFCHPKIQNAAQIFWNEIVTRHEQRSHDISKPILNPEKLFLTPQDFFKTIPHYHHYDLTHAIQEIAVPPIAIERQKTKVFERLKQFIASQPQLKILIVASSLGKREIIHDLCQASEIFPEICSDFSDFVNSSKMFALIHGPLHQKLYLPQAQVLCITEYELFDESIVYQTHKPKFDSIKATDKFIRELSELQIGMFIVHAEYGIGQYQGLCHFEDQGINNEFLILLYADGDKIYVPITNLQMITKYSSNQTEHISLHKLGSDTWHKEKRKAAEKIHDIAIELLETQAQRHAQQGLTCTIDWPEYDRFVSEFRFEETPDQHQAIQAIINDMQAPQPMDRLICGDVGFGKTEVAMRAAFIMVQNLKQVCVLVPTTLLAKQHLETFQERFANFPISIELISRFRTQKEILDVQHKLALGHIDILIGTHKLLQKTIKFHELGLIIIDEEHRFGVQQKERLKHIRHQADILSLTATPIPRTLNMALHGMRDISIIATPPEKRLAIKTFWQEKNNSLIREAILREILRGGQVYYLHNDILSIEKTTQDLKSLIPEAKIEYAHGQMHERHLEKIMGDFYHQRFNVLVATTIIETGIDIPSANTMIIERADQLGLAQLHQLRGRVGRSHHQAYAYLLSPPKPSLTADAIKRLEAIVSLENLGAGFELAMHDMEIRGAGEFLGEEQSGSMQSIGYHLYMEMLEQAVDDLKSGKIPNFEQNTQICELDLQISTIIPEDYIYDVNQRLIVYKRISMTETEDAIKQIQIELIDRFGLYPSSVKNLFAATRIQQICNALNISKLQLSQQQGLIEFRENHRIDPMKIIQLIQKQPLTFKLSPKQFLLFKLQPEYTTQEKLEFILKLLHEIKLEKSQF